VVSRKNRAGTTISFTYDTLNRLKTKAASSLPTATYAYDLNNRPLAAADNSATIATPSPAGTLATFGYAYDGVNRLTGGTWSPVAAQATPTASSATFTHAYGSTNQRMSQAASDNAFWSYPAATPGNVAYTANSLDQYTAIGAATPTYDGNDNLSNDGAFSYSCDPESRLVTRSALATLLPTHMTRRAGA
jgi:hypothetical protein